MSNYINYSQEMFKNLPTYNSGISNNYNWPVTSLQDTSCDLHGCVSNHKQWQYY
jgi:hypothetical protein